MKKGKSWALIYQETEHRQDRAAGGRQRGRKTRWRGDDDNARLHSMQRCSTAAAISRRGHRQPCLVSYSAGEVNALVKMPSAALYDATASRDFTSSLRATPDITGSRGASRGGGEGHEPPPRVSCVFRVTIWPASATSLFSSLFSLLLSPFRAAQGDNTPSTEKEATRLPSATRLPLCLFRFTYNLLPSPQHTHINLPAEDFTPATSIISIPVKAHLITCGKSSEHAAPG